MVNEQLYISLFKKEGKFSAMFLNSFSNNGLQVK